MPMSDQLPDAAIKHVVVLMLENRGFDHIMGWLYPAVADDQPSPYVAITRDDDERPFNGLSTLSAQGLAALSNPMPSGALLPINKGARSPKSPSYNTGESFEHILNQMWGVADPEDVWFDKAKRDARLNVLSQNGTRNPPMTGYVLDYDIDVFHHAKKHLGREDLSEVLDTYLPEQVPVLSGLARSYAVSDEWFCSVPSQTNTNRAFSVAGTSRGLVNNSFYDPPTWNPAVAGFKKAFGGGKSHADALPESTRSLFEVLQEANLSWKVYWQAEWPPKAFTAGVEWQYTRTMLPLLRDSQFDANFVKFDGSDLMSAFYRDARQGSLPAVSWIEPKWGGGVEWNSVKRGVGNDFHPVSDTTVGEDFVMSVYQALVAGPRWDNTLLIITFDENGGTYDHVAPPGSTPAPQPQQGAPPPPPPGPPVVPPPGNDACPLPHPPIDRGDMDPNTRTQYGFQFDQLGVRVPTLLVSPRIPKGILFRSTQDGAYYDHASLIASILKLGQVPENKWMLGERVANAPTIEALITQPPPPPLPGVVVQPEQLNRPARPLSIADGRSQGADLLFNTRYVLEYVGDPWRAQPGPIYLGASSSGLIPTYYYPTFTTEQNKAQAFTFRATGGGEELAPINNMSVLRIATTENSLMGWILLTVTQFNSCAFYSGDRSAGSAWQIRLLGSRERDDRVKEGDLVYLISQLPPGVHQSVTSLTTPDPIQRLTPYPADMRYPTTRAGEWALWRIAAAPQQN